MDVRLGETPLEVVLAELDSLIRDLQAAPVAVTDPSSDLVIERWMIETYRRHWEATWRPLGLE